MEESMSLICENIVKNYNKTEVLKNINLEIEHGKIYGLIGRNGAGKTTLLSIMTAQNPATSGSVTYDGMPVWENQKALGHLCFSREINPVSSFGPNTMKVKEYLRIASVFYPNWDKQMAKRLTELFNLDVKKKISKLSKGMMSMVTVIVALASKADITIMDEPVAGLDVVAREQFYRLVVDEYTKTGRTFIISTHIIEEAADVFEEVVILKDGMVLCKENTQELLERSMHVSGSEKEVDAVCEGLCVYHEKKMGRSKGVTVVLQQGQSLPEGYDVTVQPVSLQELFLALCGEEETL
ncbi:MAG: ABC transporter ATP-binding protein [Eubacterium sp.]|nr:ABC transporter ATP-binding protein [Eubacterium sp.]